MLFFFLLGNWDNDCITVYVLPCTRYAFILPRNHSNPGNELGQHLAWVVNDFGENRDGVGVEASTVTVRILLWL